MRIVLIIAIFLLLGWLVWVFVIRGFTPAPEDVGIGHGTPAVTEEAAAGSQLGPGRDRPYT